MPAATASASTPTSPAAARPAATLLVLATLTLAAGCAPAASDDVPTEDSSAAADELIDAGAYWIVQNWLDPFQEDGYAWGGNSGLSVESPDRIVLIQRGETLLPEPPPDDFPGWAGAVGLNVLRGEHRVWRNVLFTVDRDGTLVEVWSQWDHLFEGLDGPGPHRIRVSPYDPERRIWLIDETGHRILIFSNDGSELLATLGEPGVSGSDETHFGQPQDVAFLPDGRALVADGLLNRRVVVLDAEGRYESEFGEEGEGLGQFRSVHGLALGPDGLLFVADRDNRSVQIFRHAPDPERAYHPEFEPVALVTGFALTLDLIANEDAVWVTEVSPPRIIKIGLDGRRLHEWALPTEGPGGWVEMHSFGVDSEGNLYGTDNQNGRTQKFVPKPDADPDLLIRPPYVPR